MSLIEQIRKNPGGILSLGAHPQIFQAILDFDFLSGKSEPSLVGIIANNRRAMKLFWGRGEVLIPCFPSVMAVPKDVAKKVQWMLNVQSGRRTYDSTVAFFEAFPDALGGHLFAENVPERHATELLKRYGKSKIIAGPSGVGFLVGGKLKLGAIGGTDATMLNASHLSEEGSVAVVSTSGGMTNELIRDVALAGLPGQGKRVSFSISIGGDRFPITALEDVLMLAENDPKTEAICYFGELGGSDEYEIVELIKAKKLTKPVIAYIAGIVDEAFDEHMQFGHAKALVAKKDESARAKREALNSVGATAPETFPKFLEALSKIKTRATDATLQPMNDLSGRRPSILSTREVVDVEHGHEFVSASGGKGKKLATPRPYALSRAILEALLDREVSETTAALGEEIFESLIDHGGNVSGAVNTMITARAGKDMMSSLAAGILTVGPRFGGAVNAAAAAWIEGVASGMSAGEFVEKKTKGGNLLAGIGHRKYRVGIPDPRVADIAKFADLLKNHPHFDFARSVEEVTTAKNGKLILNVDGVMASLMLDVLMEKDGFTREELQELVQAEFFNALFIIPRSVGFIAHFMEQKKNDEGLFRLPDELLFVTKKKKV
jgi:ATP citrate (pro-S)-lyase